MKLSIEAEFVSVVEINNVRVLVVFSVKKHNALEFKKGDKITHLTIVDATGPWVSKADYTFISFMPSDMLPQHFKIEMIT